MPPGCKPGDKPDTAQFSWREVGARMVGGYAGWSSPTHILAAREDLLLGRARTARQDQGLSKLLRRLGHARLLHRLEERRPLPKRHALRQSAHRQAAAAGRDPLLPAVQGPLDRRRSSRRARSASASPSSSRPARSRPSPNGGEVEATVGETTWNSATDRRARSSRSPIRCPCGRKKRPSAIPASGNTATA